MGDIELVFLYGTISDAISIYFHFVLLCGESCNCMESCNCVETRNFSLYRKQMYVEIHGYSGETYLYIKKDMQLYVNNVAGWRHRDLSD